MFPPAKRRASSLYSLQPIGNNTKFISLPDDKGIERRYPLNDGQMDLVVSILNDPSIAQANITAAGQPSMGSLPSASSLHSAQSSQASGLNVPQSR